MTGPPRIRRATNHDGAEVRALVASVLAEFGLPNNRPGTDDDLHDIEGFYDARGGRFGVLEENGGLIGTVAIARVDAADARTCELRKMYLRPEARGRGLGSTLMDYALETALRLGYRRMVLETADVLTDAIRLYERRGFRQTGEPADSLGCGLRYRLDLASP